MSSLRLQFSQFLPQRAGGVWLLFFASILAAWVLLAMMAADVPGYGVMHLTEPSLWRALCQSAAQAEPLALWGMWALMSLAMMMPTFIPTLRVYSDLSAIEASDGRSIAALSFGYLIVWIGFSGVAALVQAQFAKAGLVGPDGSSLSLLLTALLLGVAGLYQFSNFKDACLSRCRMPLTFFLERWAAGVGPAFKMGLELGLVCLGCCWALMALGFVGGTMNLLWMGAATLFMVMEKLPQIGRYLTRPLGVILLGSSMIIALRALGIL